jgi:hypothetical protein
MEARRVSYEENILRRLLRERRRSSAANVAGSVSRWQKGAPYSAESFWSRIAERDWALLPYVSLAVRPGREAVRERTVFLESLVAAREGSQPS